MKNKTLLIIAALCVAVVLLYYLTQPKGPGPYDEFAKCLTAKGFSMAGTDTCPGCKKQKEAFESSFEYIDFHNCQYEGPWCNQRGIKYYPTWILPGGQEITGVQTLKYLEDLSNCSMEQVDTCPAENNSDVCSINKVG